MTNQSQDEPRSFSELSSASEEAQWHHAGQSGGASASSGRAGANSRPDEITTLERRVLAHERILQALLGHLSEDDPEILAQLKARFGNSHNIGEYEHDYVSTDQYCAHFIESIESEVAERRRKYDAAGPRSER